MSYKQRERERGGRGRERGERAERGEREGEREGATTLANKWERKYHIENEAPA